MEPVYTKDGDCYSPRNAFSTILNYNIQMYTSHWQIRLTKAKWIQSLKKTNSTLMTLMCTRNTKSSDKVITMTTGSSVRGDVDHSCDE